MTTRFFTILFFLMPSLALASDTAGSISCKADDLSVVLAGKTGSMEYIYGTEPAPQCQSIMEETKQVDNEDECNAFYQSLRQRCCQLVKKISSHEQGIRNYQVALTKYRVIEGIQSNLYQTTLCGYVAWNADGSSTLMSKADLDAGKFNGNNIISQEQADKLTSKVKSDLKTLQKAVEGYKSKSGMVPMYYGNSLVGNNLINQYMSAPLYDPFNVIPNTEYLYAHSNTQYYVICSQGPHHNGNVYMKGGKDFYPLYGAICLTNGTCDNSMGGTCLEGETIKAAVSPKVQSDLETLQKAVEAYKAKTHKIPNYTITGSNTMESDYLVPQYIPASLYDPYNKTPNSEYSYLNTDLKHYLICSKGPSGIGSGGCNGFDHFIPENGAICISNAKCDSDWGGTCLELVHATVLHKLGTGHGVQVKLTVLTPEIYLGQSIAANVEVTNLGPDELQLPSPEMAEFGSLFSPDNKNLWYSGGVSITSINGDVPTVSLNPGESINKKIFLSGKIKDHAPITFRIGFKMTSDSPVVWSNPVTVTIKNDEPLQVDVDVSLKGSTIDISKPEHPQQLTADVHISNLSKTMPQDIGVDDICGVHELNDLISDNKSIGVISARVACMNSFGGPGEVILQPGEAYDQTCRIEYKGQGPDPGPIVFHVGVKSIGHLPAWSNPIKVSIAGGSEQWRRHMIYVDNTIKENTTPHPDGVFKKYSENGHLLYETNYQNGQENGKRREYFDDGKLSMETLYRNGEIVSYIAYNHDGSVYSHMQYMREVNGKFIHSPCTEADDHNTAVGPGAFPKCDSVQTDFSHIPSIVQVKNDLRKLKTALEAYENKTNQIPTADATKYLVPEYISAPLYDPFNFTPHSGYSYFTFKTQYYAICSKGPGGNGNIGFFSPAGTGSGSFTPEDGAICITNGNCDTSLGGTCLD